MTWDKVCNSLPVLSRRGHQHSGARELESTGWSGDPGLVAASQRPGPYPLVMNLHGGPVGHSRPRWLRRAGVHILMLLKRGYVVFFPNPRGSGGRGRDFARYVYGDLGGADAKDLLSGLDALVERGVTDPKRLGVVKDAAGCARAPVAS
jgi:dipeptidyl aminopeptidase/acylaminoacyl peptidase